MPQPPIATGRTDPATIIAAAQWHNTNPRYAGYPRLSTYRAEIGRPGREAIVTYFNVEDGTEPLDRLRVIHTLARMRDARVTLAGAFGL